MKKIILILLFFTFLALDLCAQGALFQKKPKEKPYIILSDSDIKEQTNYNPKAQKISVFEINKRIYFYVYNPKGFETDYIRYQIVKQDDNAHEMGYNRIRNITRRLKDKYSYSDYFVLSQKGKYAIQIFDITNLHQWVAIGAFNVIEN